jgi:AcrR family transcriptional regulator
MKPDRIYHHYENLEEFHAGMWRIVSGSKRKEFADAAADLMRTPDEFKEAMLSAIEQWPKSCEMNLTAEAVNKLAWLGHSGCCISVQSPEDCTRLGWHQLNQDEQNEANRVAQEVLDTWLAKHKQATRPDLFSSLL